MPPKRTNTTTKPKPPPPTFPTHAFPTAADFETYLDKHHETTPGVNIRLAKKATNIPSTTHAEAVEVALMFGWIDGGGHGIDDRFWVTRYLPRKPRSIWSQRNVATVERLTEGGKMRPAGLRVVEAAKADGRWERAYATPSTMEVPSDFEEALRAVPEAWEVWEGLKRGERYAVMMKLVTVVPKNRAKKIDSLVQSLASGEPVKPVSAPKKKSAGAESGAVKSADVQKAVAKRPAARKASGRGGVQNTSSEVDTGSIEPRRAGLRARR